MMIKTKNKIRAFTFFVVALLCSGRAFSQASEYSIIGNLKPITPTAWQFSKYTDLPVSEYTGLPNISIPLYEIKEDGINIPLSLGYHAGGIKVNEEASWVGLGWDMTVGSIVQQIADQDDYAVARHLQPDFYNTGTPSLFPLKYAWATPITGSFDLVCAYGCGGPLGTPITPFVANGIEIYTGEYAPYNGDYGYALGPNYLNFFSSHDVGFGFSIDSEPDVFTANFLGHSFKFIRDPQTGLVVVLNKQGYKVTRTGQVWTILVPSGEEYDFELKDVINTVSNSTSITGTQSSSNPLPSSNIWFLTKIITKNKKIITFTYTQTATQAVYPTVTERGSTATLQSTHLTGNAADWGTFAQSADVTNATPGLGICPSVSYSSEQYTYLSGITFPQGTVNFSLSARSDIQGGLKLDSMLVSSDQLVKDYKFNYAYFDASSVGGNTYSFPPTAGSWGTCPLYRLKLLSLTDNSGGTYNFSYNGTQLPAKNSFAVDFWGYYNGATGNATFIPSGSQFGKTGWPTNSDNHSANAAYTKACILQGVQYPTGGTANFTYELNQFNNYWVPDYTTNTNTISSGDGLRIQSITWNETTGAQLKKTNYTYSGGMASVPFNFFRNYSYNTCPPQALTPGNAYVINRLYTVYETNMNGLYSANPFASFNGVGYSQVTKTDVDNLGTANGKTISNYYNTPDLVYNSITAVSQAAPTLPAYKDPGAAAENGSLQSELYYDSSNNLLKQVANTYTKVNSPVYYGARLMGYAGFVRYVQDISTLNYNESVIPQSMVGYYPIYDFETLLSGSTETDYFGSQSVTVTTSNTYDIFNQISSTSKSNSTLSQTTQFTYPYNTFPVNPVLTAMVAQNRLSDIVTVTKSGGTYFNLFRNYQQIGSLFLPSTDQVVTETTTQIPENTTYDSFDAGNGNLLQYTKNTLTNSFIYDYNKEYVTAEVKNAAYTSIAYTSFEAPGKGRWKYSGSTSYDATAPTGFYDYSLGSGSIYRDSLNTSLSYYITYWSKNGPQNVNGNTTPNTGASFNGWTFYQHLIANPSGGTITVSGTGTIDELRLYPSNAQMTTYTYEPLVGISSVSDAGGKASYYEYDAARRLRTIRDMAKNIIKSYCYNFAGQSTNCFVPQSNPHPSVIYARLEEDNSNFSFAPNFQGAYDYTNTVDVYIRFYSDAACTVPLVLSASLPVSVGDNGTFWDDMTASYSFSTATNSYTVPSGVSSYFIGTQTTSYEHTFYDSFGNFWDNLDSWTYYLNTGGYTIEF